MKDEKRVSTHFPSLVTWHWLLISNPRAARRNNGDPLAEPAVAINMEWQCARHMCTKLRKIISPRFSAALNSISCPFYCPLCFSYTRHSTESLPTFVIFERQENLEILHNFLKATQHSWTQLLT